MVAKRTKGKRKEPKYRIYPLSTAQTIIPKIVFLYLTPNLGEMVIPALFWYIEGADRHILVDTAGSAKGLQENARFGNWEDVRSFEECLRNVGIMPDDIDIVIQTHLHHDHVLNTRKCRNAKVYVQRAELAHAQAPHPVSGKMYRWFEKWGRDLDYVVIDGDYELLPGIELLLVPGHSAGCQAVAINTDRGKAIITGFCSIQENFNPPASLKDHVPAICPGIHLNAAQAYESLLRVKQQADIILPVHEPSLISIKYI